MSELDTWDMHHRGASLNTHRFRPAVFAAALLPVVAILSLCMMAGCRTRQPQMQSFHGAQHLDFNQDVQPILASNCLSISNFPQVAKHIRMTQPSVSKRLHVIERRLQLRLFQANPTG